MLFCALWLQSAISVDKDGRQNDHQTNFMLLDNIRERVAIYHDPFRIHGHTILTVTIATERRTRIKRRRFFKISAGEQADAK